MIKNFLGYNIQTLRAQLLKESESAILWIPVLFGTGVLLYLTLSFEPHYLIAPSTLILLFLLRKYRLLLIALATITCGFMTTQLHAILLKAPILEQEIKFAKVTGVLESITPLEHGNRLLIAVSSLEGLQQLPKKIRITARTSLNDAKAGDLISVRANLLPPPTAQIISSYNFARPAFFQQIGAVGYAVSAAQVIKASDHFYMLERLRHNILTKINVHLRPELASIASSLMIGEYKSIDKLVIADMRAAGVSHILSVSGMHLSLVAAIFFFVTRLIVNLLYPWTCYLNAKKIAAYVAILGSLFYLLISGLQVAAIRSFIMTAMVIVSVLLDRVASPMRSIAFASLLIMLLTPQDLLNPSFQMSFAAVIALVACYHLYIKLYGQRQNHNLSGKIWFYFLSTIFSSLVAGLATTPFALYHFNQYSNYGVLANLAIVPITSFIIMPCVILAFLLLPFGLEQVALVPMGWAIEWVISISQQVAHLPHAVKLLPYMPELSLLLITIGGLWLALWQYHIRLAGLVPIIAGIAIMAWQPRANLIIDSKTGMFAFQESQDLLVFSGKKIGKFAKENWLHYTGSKSSSVFDDRQSYHNFYKNDNLCTYKLGGFMLQFACFIDHNNCLVINSDLTLAEGSQKRKAILLSDFVSGGIYAVALTSHDHLIETISSTQGNRLWQGQ